MDIASVESRRVGPEKLSVATFLGSPVFLLLLALVGCALALSIAIQIPLGPNYWDLAIYLDGAHRLALGQVPSVDFSAPVGALGYYLMYWGTTLFPNGHPLLVVQWSVLAITAPLMLWLVMQVGRRSRSDAFALLLPFLVFQILPFNVAAYSTYPGVDGYGIYNRQVCILLYVMVAVLQFGTGALLRAGSVFVIVTSLFFLKITGFGAAGIIALYALISGRISLIQAMLAGVGFAVVVGISEFLVGIPSAYLQEILVLAGLNSGTLLPRFLTVFSVRFDTIFSCGLLIIMLGALTLFSRENSSNSNTRKQVITKFLDRPVFWLIVLLGAGIIFETQNTGSQEFIFLWPVLLRVLRSYAGQGSALSPDWKRWMTVGLVAATALPTLVEIVHRSARAATSIGRYVSLDVEHLAGFGMVNVKPKMFERIEMMGDHYAAHQPAYEDLTRRGQLSSWTFYSEITMQGTWLVELNRAIARLLELEKKSELRINSVYVLDFASPIAWAMGRGAPKNVQIGLDSSRTMKNLDEETKSALQSTTGILKPLCPVTTGRTQIAANYSPALEGRVAVALDRCWTLYLNPADAKRASLD